MRPGEPFNSHGKLRQVMIPISLFGDRLGQKRAHWPQAAVKAVVSDQALTLYGVMQYHKANNSTRCMAGAATLAAELGVSRDTIERRASELADAGLIKVIRTGGGKENQYEFLWSEHLTGSLRRAPDDAAELRHPAVGTDAAEVRHQTGDHPAGDIDDHPSDHPEGDLTASDTAGLPPVMPHNCGDDAADLPLAYKEVREVLREVRREVKSSSSSVGCGGENDEDSLRESTNTSPAERDAKPAGFEMLRDFLIDSVTNTLGRPPERPPHESDVLAVFHAAKGWSVEQIIEAFHVNHASRKGRPVVFAWFTTTMADIFKRFGGKPPAVGGHGTAAMGEESSAYIREDPPPQLMM